jgi:phospholipid/cholesterol/gamma-HCH transport system permease protein
MSAAQLRLSQPGAGVLRVQVSGSWALAKGLPSTSEVEQAIDGGEALSRLCFDAGSLEAWDSSLVNVIYKLVRHSKRAGVPSDLSGLPEGLRGLLALAEAVAPHQAIQEHHPDASFLADVGSEALEFFRSVADILRFVGGVSAPGRVTPREDDRHEYEQRQQSERLRQLEAGHVDAVEAHG